MTTLEHAAAWQDLRGWNEITWSFLVDLRRGIVQMTKLIKSSPLTASVSGSRIDASLSIVQEPRSDVDLVVRAVG
jgi:hypothetical protein